MQNVLLFSSYGLISVHVMLSGRQQMESWSEKKEYENMVIKQ